MHSKAAWCAPRAHPEQPQGCPELPRSGPRVDPELRREAREQPEVANNYVFQLRKSDFVNIAFFAYLNTGITFRGQKKQAQNDPTVTQVLAKSNHESLKGDRLRPKSGQGRLKTAQDRLNTVQDYAKKAPSRGQKKTRTADTENQIMTRPPRDGSKSPQDRPELNLGCSSTPILFENADSLKSCVFVLFCYISISRGPAWESLGAEDRPQTTPRGP